MTTIFDLGDSGGSDVAASKDHDLAEAFAAGRTRREGDGIGRAKGTG